MADPNLASYALIKLKLLFFICLGILNQLSCPKLACFGKEFFLSEQICHLPPLLFILKFNVKKSDFPILAKRRNAIDRSRTKDFCRKYEHTWRHMDMYCENDNWES